MIAAESLGAANDLPGALSLCSQRHGWSTLLLRRYDEPLEADFATRPTSDQLIVLVKRGRCTIESHSPRGWRSARYRTGDLGMTSPGEAGRLRFFGSVPHQTLQLHIPAAMLTEVAELAGKPFPRFDELQFRHDMVTSIILRLERALELGAPVLYAESALRFLLMQLLWDSGLILSDVRRDTASVQTERLEDYLRARLSEQIELADMAAELEMSVFQLIRLCRSAWQTTPFAHLTAIRMDYGKTLLSASNLPISSIAQECGYENPSHFATAFRRQFGVAPSGYRKISRL